MTRFMLLSPSGLSVYYDESEWRLLFPFGSAKDRFVVRLSRGLRRPPPALVVRSISSPSLLILSPSQCCSACFGVRPAGAFSVLHLSPMGLVVLLMVMLLWVLLRRASWKRMACSPYAAFRALVRVPLICPNPDTPPTSFAAFALIRRSGDSLHMGSGYMSPL